MSRRNTELFSLSFLDLLSGALGAVIFLFIITPKGREAPAVRPQVELSIDSIHNQIFGAFHDSLSAKNIGDTLLVIIKDFQKVPSIEDCPEYPPPVECPECPKCPERYIVERHSKNNNTKTSSAEPTRIVEEKESIKPVKVNQQPPKTKQENTTTKQENDPGYKGDPPSVPCKVSFEITWEDITNNVDLFVCREGKCVSGGKKKNKRIGYWDSGKSTNSIFGSDLRTTMEAVRQFDKVIPGEYQLYARFKAREKENNSVAIQGLVYTKGTSGQQGKRFTKQIQFQKEEKTLLAKVRLKADGTFTMY